MGRGTPASRPGLQVFQTSLWKKPLENGRSLFMYRETNGLKSGSTPTRSPRSNLATLWQTTRSEVVRGMIVGATMAQLDQPPKAADPLAFDPTSYDDLFASF